MKLCSHCNKNIAVLYISTTIDGEPKMKGLCLSCAKKLNIPGVDQILKNAGIKDEDVDSVTQKMNESIENLEKNLGNLNMQDSENGSQLMNYMNNMFNNFLKNHDPEDIKYDDDGNPYFYTNFEDNDDDNYDDNDEDDDYYIKDEVDNNGNFFDSMKNLFSNDDNQKTKKPKMKTIEKFGTDLTKLARERKLDKVVGREKEIKRVVQILNRRTKNNPALLGAPGVGKTAIAEGLAMLIVDKKVPVKLQDYHVVQLELSTLVAGTQFRGQFEQRMKNIVDEARENKNVILVIDEIHSLVGAGETHGGSLDAANILKPALARGEIQIIGTTTIEEYRKYIEKDKALERRFQSVIVEEPSVDESVEIISGIKNYYEDYHLVKISDEVIENAVKFSKRYITDRFLPDKAIDLIDEAGSTVNLENKNLQKIKELENRVEQIKNLELKASVEADYEKAAGFKQKEIQISKELQNLQEEKYKSLTTDDIAKVVEQWTKIPVRTITESEADKLLRLEDTLSKRLIGQDKALNTVARAIRRNRAGISKVKRPSSFLFVGPTGVGKTQLVKELAKEMFGSEDMMIRLDMSEYMEKHSVSKLIGAPPGYVGYEEGGQLTDKIKRKPYSIILLDEIEKAHEDVFNMLLQIMEDGRLTDAQGEQVHFENSIIILTSNIGTTFKNKSLGFGAKDDDIEEERIKEALKDHFKPEFLNRLDEIVIFNKLTKNDLMKIVNIMLSELIDTLQEKGIHLIVTEEVKEYILEKGYDEKYGARPLRRTIQRYIEDEIAEKIIGQEVKIDKIFAKMLNKKLLLEEA